MIVFSTFAFSFPTKCGLDFVPTAKREPCRRSDPGFSRIPNWRRRCMDFYFSSSWNGSPFEAGSEVFMC